MLKMQQQGKIRYIGFSGHRRCESHVRMLQLAKEKGVRFDTCQMPVNVVEQGYASYMHEAMPMALEQGTAIVAMKTLANGGLFGRGASVSQPAPEKTVTLIPGRLTVAEATNFVWSLPVSTIISGMDNAAQLQEKIDLARRFTAMSEQARKDLVARLADASGRVAEPYKE
jgi:predicted aldo/keto reductase-like oxidoreductase